MSECTSLHVKLNRPPDAVLNEDETDVLENTLRAPQGSFFTDEDLFRMVDEIALAIEERYPDHKFRLERIAHNAFVFSSDGRKSGIVLVQ